MADSQMTEHSDRTSELEHQLREREQVVAALTERLEQAADQLDRLRRTGADRGPRTAGMPAQLVESQQSLLEDLQTAVQQWEDLQAATSLGRLETQLTEMRDLMIARFDQLSEHGVRTAAPGTTPRRQSASEQPGTPPADSKASSPKQSEPVGTLAGWDAVKAMLLAEDSATEAGSSESDTSNSIRSARATDEHTSGQRDSSADTARQQPGDSSSGFTADDDGQPVRFPEPVDVDQADRDELAIAVLERDECIASLIRQLREADMQLCGTIDWDSLTAAPEELTSQLQHMQLRLQQRLSEAEVELSLERARLAREEVRLKQMETQLRRQSRQLGLHPEAAEEKSPAGGAAEKEREGSGKWMRLLGRSGHADS